MERVVLDVPGMEVTTGQVTEVVSPSGLTGRRRIELRNGYGGENDA